MITKDQAIMIYESVLRRRANSPQPLYKVCTHSVSGTTEFFTAGSFVFVGDMLISYDANGTNQTCLIRSTLTGYFDRNIASFINLATVQAPNELGIFIFDSLSLTANPLNIASIQLVLTGYTFTNI